MTDVTLSQLSLSIRQKSKFSSPKSRRQLPTTASHGCSASLLTSWRMDKIPAVPLFFLMHGAIGLESLMCKVLSRQRVLMNQLLGHRTRVTLRSSPRQDDQNLNLLNSWVGPAETALVSSTCTATAQSFQQGDLVACEASIRFIEIFEMFLIYGISKQKLAQTSQTQFCCSLIPINLILIAFIWLHLANDHFKNI